MAYTGTDYTVFAHERTMGIVKKLSHQGLRPRSASAAPAARKDVSQEGLFAETRQRREKREKRRAASASRVRSATGDARAPSEASGSSAAVKSEQCWPVGERPPPCTHFVKL